MGWFRPCRWRNSAKGLRVRDLGAPWGSGGGSVADSEPSDIWPLPGSLCFGFWCSLVRKRRVCVWKLALWRVSRLVGRNKDDEVHYTPISQGEMSVPLLVDIPLENRERSSPLKKLCTAVSRESPDLFRIHGVPCIDRGPDESGPPVAYEHWNDNSGRSGLSKWQKKGDDIKKTPNFARPSSVSADTPNFFKVTQLYRKNETKTR